MNIALLFIFHARPDKVDLLLSSCLVNASINDLPFYIYIDGCSANTDKNLHKSVIRLSEDYVSRRSGGKIVLRNENYGLKKNITYGINDVLKVHEAVIVLEEDILPSKYFFDFMRHSLLKYRDVGDVWHINGWTYLNEDSVRYYLGEYVFCWGWATWADRWEKSRFDVGFWNSKMSLGMKLKLSKYLTAPYYSHYVGNKLGLNNTWAIFWFLTVLYYQGKAVTPTVSLVENLGNDGSGSHRVLYKSLSKEVSLGFQNTDVNYVDSNLDIKILIKQVKMAGLRGFLSNVRNFLRV